MRRRPSRAAEAERLGRRHRGWRVVPDVAALADPTTGFLVGQTQAESAHQPALRARLRQRHGGSASQTARRS
jgi:hypothetical protein